MQGCNGNLHYWSPTHAEGEKKVILTHRFKCVRMSVCTHALQRFMCARKRESERERDDVHFDVLDGACGMKEEERETDIARIQDKMRNQSSYRSYWPLKAELTSNPASVCRHAKLFNPDDCTFPHLMV